MPGLQPYSAYKPSGVEWLGEIPEGWGEAKIKHGYNIRLGKMLQPQPGSNEDTLEPYLRSANVFWEGIDINDIQSMWFSSYEKRLYEIFPGDLIVCEGGDVGRAAIWEGQISPCYIQNAVHRISPKPGFLNKYLYYWLFTLKTACYIDLICSKATISHLTGIKLANLPLIIPPLPEQRAIADFLDRETARLDALVSRYRRLLELLAEKRAALISRAVTRGLDENVKLKPSGIEWLGEIPEHWNIKKLKHIADLKSGDGITTENIQEVGDYPVYGGNGFRGYTNAYTHEGNYVLIGRQGALCGNINYAQGKFWASEHAIVARPKQAIITYWFGEVLRTANLNQYSISSAQPGIAIDRINEIFLPFPPLKEQRLIAAYLEGKTARLDGIRARVEEMLAKLQEYRAALIYAAVTGKVDVRTLTPALSLSGRGESGGAG